MPSKKARHSQPDEQLPLGNGSGISDEEMRFRTYAFQQALLQRSCLKEEKARALYTRLTNDTSEEGYLAMVAACNASLGFLQLSIRRLKFSIDKEWYVGVVNQVGDEVSKKHGTRYSIAEVQYLRALIVSIALLPDAEDGEGFIRTTEALHVQPLQTQAAESQSASQAKELSLGLTAKEAALDKFKEDMWLINPDGDDGLIGIGVRAFLELHELLLSLDLPDATREAWEKFL